MAEMCSCNKPKVFRTSWSDDNPERRYKMCAKYRKPGGCRDFEFIDPFCPRCHAIIPGLLRRINEREADLVDINATLEERNVALEEKEAALAEKDQELKAKKEEVDAIELQMKLMSVEYKLKEEMSGKKIVDLSRNLKKLWISVVIGFLCLIMTKVLG